MPGSTILSDIKVVDLTSVIFGPYCTQMLADMGADVVKVEPEKGDDFRLLGRPGKTNGMGPGHMTVNRGKRSVTWDLRSDIGRKAIHRLIARSDVFIHNVREDAIMRLDLDFDAVKAIKPDIVYIHCTGFGSDGPYAGRPAYDDIIQGLSGMATLLPRVNGNEVPQFIPMTIADKVSGLHATYATLAALRQRDKSGEAIKVEVPMFESVTHFLMEEHLYGQTFVPPNGKVGYPRQLDSTRQPMATKDGWITIAPYMDGRWVRFFKAVNREDVLAEERFSDPVARFRNTPAMQLKMAEIVKDQTSAHWLELLEKADIPAARVNDLAEVIDDPHMKAVGFFQTRIHPTEGKYLEMQPPIKFGGQGERVIRAAPHLGEHNDEILKELGL